MKSLIFWSTWGYCKRLLLPMGMRWFQITQTKTLLDDNISQQESYQATRQEYLYSMFKELALSPTRNRVPPTICNVWLIRLLLFDIVDTNIGIQSLRRPETINDEMCSWLTYNPKFPILMLIERRFLSIQLNGVNSEKVGSTFWEIFCVPWVALYMPRGKRSHPSRACNRTAG